MRRAFLSLILVLPVTAACASDGERSFEPDVALAGVERLRAGCTLGAS